MIDQELADFLLARFAELEARAQACAALYPPPWDLTDRGYVAYVKADAPSFRTVAELEQEHAPADTEWLGDVLAHVAIHDPKFVLTDIVSKRYVVEHLANFEGPKRTLKERIFGPAADTAYQMGIHASMVMMAQPFHEHSDFRPRWQRVTECLT